MQVCGEPVLYNDEPDFELCASYLLPLENKDDDLSFEFYEDQHKRVSVLKKIAARNGCRFTSRWNHLVHAK